MVCRCRMVGRMVGVSKETLLVDLIKNGKIDSWGEAPCYLRACKRLLLNQKKLYNTLRSMIHTIVTNNLYLLISIQLIVQHLPMLL